MASELFHRAVKLAHSGRKDEARAIFKRELEINPQYEPAWMWYVDCQPSDEDRIRVLHECLRSIPDSQSAQRVLDMLMAQQSGEAANTESAVPIQDEMDAMMSMIDTHQQVQPGGLDATTVSPFTISPDEVTEADLLSANENLFSKFDDIFENQNTNFEERVDPTQPTWVTPSSLMPDEEEINHYIYEPGLEENGESEDWQPTFSDDIVAKFRGSLDVKTQPRSASTPVPTRPRPTSEELTNRPLFTHLEPAKTPPESPVIETHDEESPQAGGRKDGPFFTPKRILIILAVCVGITFILVVIAIILLFMI